MYNKKNINRNNKKCVLTSKDVQQSRADNRGSTKHDLLHTGINDWYWSVQVSVQTVLDGIHFYALKQQAVVDQFRATRWAQCFGNPSLAVGRINRLWDFAGDRTCAW